MTTNEREQFAAQARELVDLGEKWKGVAVTPGNGYHDVLLEGPEGRYMLVVITAAARDAWLDRCWPPRQYLTHPTGTAHQ